jgi:hypothetical protein
MELGSRGREWFELIVGSNKVIIGVRCVLTRLQSPPLAAVRLVMGKARMQYGAVLRLGWAGLIGALWRAECCQYRYNTKSPSHKCKRNDCPVLREVPHCEGEKTEPWDRVVQAIEKSSTRSTWCLKRRIDWSHSPRRQLHWIDNLRLPLPH